MKKRVIVSGILVVSLCTSGTFAQTNCKVLMPSIASSYKGDCKDGLAHGKGEASGTDRYTGDFKKGLPDGDGIYFWRTGEIHKGEWKKGVRDGRGEFTFKTSGRDSVLIGVWKEDKYVGKEAVSPYMVGYRNNVGRILFMKMVSEKKPYYVKYKFSRAGESSSFLAITNLLLQGSSGSENISTSFTGFEDVIFPFEGKIQFNAPNALNTASLNCETRITINEPGSWLVTIYY